MTRCIRQLRNLIRFAYLLLTMGCNAGRFLLLCLRPSPALAAENLFLRKQLALYQERRATPRRATNTTRLVLVWLSRCFDGAYAKRQRWCRPLLQYWSIHENTITPDWRREDP